MIVDWVVIKQRVRVRDLDWNGRFDVVVRLTGKSYYGRPTNATASPPSKSCHGELV